MLDLFLGDPVYDEQKNVIRRDFGHKNIVALITAGALFLYVMIMIWWGPLSGRKLKKRWMISGKRKMKGGVDGPVSDGKGGGRAMVFLLFLLFLAYLFLGPLQNIF